ncbi:MAG TPA: peptide ABC transporter permease [Gammaproteobacteria bacterium]|jgi:peptide/nickel transport system permease protein|uniref:Oligopeptide transport system permease protein OppB (TC 3.A.1.5.1) n=2 Tax=hydrothermal vent metagenome TaxID=652676 RepID=A0A1W1DXB7_9ZZZZ|nr:peptide ABC transporter permease [Gammaproteobacteria bacterium]HAE04394.1 peptide ABC transporter permease [Gammaproteobacteria bacterium]HAE70637.1 peptide ABC transporter permease [Gammaproteobacteria bacterium]HAG47522.1 peptide ABC transporter permease [Gammaproteobacteria bacterium]HAN33458.1 peptide ABC transporter permease [Gammaproteobacteria bacterium]
MWTYILRRALYSIPILLGVNLITFLLFFMVNTPDDMARIQLGAKHVTQADIHTWKEEKGYNKPLFVNTDQSGSAILTDTIFYQKSIPLFQLDFGHSDSGRNINKDISQRMWPSLALAIPSFIIALITNIVFAMWMVMLLGTKLERMSLIFTVALMSISGLFYIIIGQKIVAGLWHWFPVSGYQDGLESWRFVLLPVLIGVVAGLGSGVRWYRSIFLEEINKPYVNTARAKGLSEQQVLFKHVLKNAMIPILTGVVVIIPSLFMGSLIMESFFSIPGLGSYTIDAINSQDFAIVRAMVFLGSILYIIGLLLTDISYTWVDPRVKFK